MDVQFIFQETDIFHILDGGDHAVTGAGIFNCHDTRFQMLFQILHHRVLIDVTITQPDTGIGTVAVRETAEQQVLQVGIINLFRQKFKDLINGLAGLIQNDVAVVIIDPHGIVEMRELIKSLQAEGITFLISSHILSELSLIANRYGIISKGKLLQEITAKELHDRCDKSTTITANDPQALGALIKDCVNNRVEYIPNGVRILGAVDLNKVLAPVLAAGIRVQSINCGESTFEDYYLSVIGGAKQ